jgi:hypothetical protein
VTQEERRNDGVDKPTSRRKSAKAFARIDQRGTIPHREPGTRVVTGGPKHCEQFGKIVASLDLGHPPEHGVEESIPCVKAEL